MAIADLPMIAEGTILHIEDEKAYERFFSPKISRTTFQYKRVSILSEANEYIDLIQIVGFIVDLRLHSHTSTELIKRIREKRPRTPLVIYTKYPHDPELQGLVNKNIIAQDAIYSKADLDAVENIVSRFEIEQCESTSLPENVDLGLLQLMEKTRRGLLRPNSSTRVGEIPVVARITDIEAWRCLEGVREGVAIPRRSGGEWIVTGRLQAEAVENVRRQPFVLNLEAPRPLRPSLAISRKEASLPDCGKAAPLGTGTVVGIVDFGCDFAHHNFRKSDGATRLLALWHQDGKENGNGTALYGTLFEGPEIDSALTSDKSPYEALGYKPEEASHGTHVMDIAAGGGMGTGMAGVAGAADLVFVHLTLDGISLGVGHLADSVHLLEAINFVFQSAEDRPCVINLSLGDPLGPHDGTSDVETGIDDLVKAAPNRAVVVAAGNFFANAVHSSGVIPQDGSFELAFELAPDDGAILDLWYDGEDRFSAELISPVGASFGEVELGRSRSWSIPKGGLPMTLVHHAGHPNNGDNRIQVFLDNGVPVGVWRLRFRGVEILDGRFHAWLDSTTGRGAHCFLLPRDNSHTLGCLSCGHESIVVGAYNAHSGRALCSFSSAGPTRDGRQKPELSAPGERVAAAKALHPSQLKVASGTSMAAPVVTGVVAAMLSEARVRGVQLESSDIREILREAAQLGPPPKAWDDRYGWGRVDAQAAILAVRELCVARTRGSSSNETLLPGERNES